MRKLACMLAVMLVVAIGYAAPFTPGNLVVTRFGDGVATLTSAAAPTFLLEYSPAGTLVQTIPMPTVAGSYGRAFTNAGSASSEGFLKRSVDGQYLTLAGYDATVGTLAVPSTLPTATNRVVGIVNAAGTYDTNTALTDVTGNHRSAVSTNGTDIWLTSSSRGSQYTTAGATTSTQLATAPTNARVTAIFGNQLYTSSGSASYIGVDTVGTGLPTTIGQTVSLLIPDGGTSPSPYDFYFFNSTTAYVADDRTVANGGGLQKYVYSAGAWSLAYTLSVNLTAGLRSVTNGTTDGSGNPVFFATSADSLTKFLTVTDTGSTAPFTTLATVGTNMAFRGVAYAPIPEPGSLILLALGALSGLLRRR